MSKFLDKLKKYIPVPKMISFNHAGIDIGLDHIRHISLKKDGGKLFVDKFGVEDLTKTIDKNQTLLENDEVVETLRKIQKKFKYKYVKVSLPEEISYIYTQEVDNVDPSSIRGQIEFKMEENVPIKAEDTVFEYVDVLDLKNDRKLISVSVVSKKNIEDYVDTFKKANMEIISFLIQNQALSKSLIKDGDKKSYCVVAIEKTYVVVSVISSDIVLYTSTISKKLFDDNLNLERKEILEDVIKDIYRILIFWVSYIEQNKSYGFDKINSIIVSSTYSNIIESEFINMLTDKLAIQIDKPNVWTNVVDFNDQIPPIDKIDSYKYATAIGLTLSKLK